MYHTIVKRNLRKAFQQINAGDYDSILAQFGPEFEHVCAGDHPLTGRRTSPASNAAWYARLAAILPDLHFDIETIVVNGWPWNTRASVEWRDTFTLPDGSRGNNQGVHVFRLVWGKVASLHIYTDTQKLSDYCEKIGALGITEATAVPIED